MRALWLADVLRAAGLTVVEHSGWRTRGWEPWAPRYGIAHATAAPRSQSDAVQVAIVRDGHSTLQGPIANAVVDRRGRWHVVASGRCNTAKVGWAGPANGMGNTSLLGVEACNDNRGEPWSNRQYDAYARGWAAICRRMGWSADRVVGHKEHQPGDKSDPSFSMATFRTRIAQAIEEDDVSARDVWTTDGILPIPRLAASGGPRPTAEVSSDPHWKPATYMRATYENVARVRGDHDKMRATLEAVLTAVSGGDHQAVLERIDQHHAEQMQAIQDAESRATAQRDELLELVAQRDSGELTAEQVVTEMARRLAAAGGSDGSE